MSKYDIEVPDICEDPAQPYMLMCAGDEVPVRYVQRKERSWEFVHKETGQNCYVPFSVLLDWFVEESRGITLVLKDYWIGMQKFLEAIDRKFRAQERWKELQPPAPEPEPEPELPHSPAVMTYTCQRCAVWRPEAEVTWTDEKLALEHLVQFHGNRVIDFVLNDGYVDAGVMLDFCFDDTQREK